jgi:hypothetical protein
MRPAAEETMRHAVFVVLLLALAGGPALAQTYHAGDVLGERLAKTKSLSSPNNAGGRNILQNSCLNKPDFSISASDTILDHCDLAEATRQFVAKHGPPDRTSQAPGAKNVLEYFLLFKENEYHVKMFLGCAEKTTEAFAMVECVNEKNRFVPGGPPGRHGDESGPGGWGGRRP